MYEAQCFVVACFDADSDAVVAGVVEFLEVFVGFLSDVCYPEKAADGFALREVLADKVCDFQEA